MVKLRILEILSEKNHSKYWLWKQLDGMSYQNFNKIATNKTSSISFNTLDRISSALNCEIGELFEKTESDEDEET